MSLMAWVDQPPLPGRVGAWLASHIPDLPFGTVGSVATTAFEAYAVVPDRTDGFNLSESTASVLRAHLRRWTSDAESCVQALWDGHGELGGGAYYTTRPANPLLRLAQRAGRRRPGLLPEQYRDELVVPVPRLLSADVEARSRFEIPDRAYYAFAAHLPDLAPRPWGGDEPGDQSADLFWPCTRTWLVACDVDLLVTFIGGPQALIDSLTGDPQLGASPVTADQQLAKEWVD